MGRIVFAAMVIGGLVLSSVCFGYSGGSGTPEEPYQIANKADLLELAATTTDYNECFILTADVNLEGQVWTTAIIATDTVVGNWEFDGTAFTGTFDGNSHKITNFTINGNDYLGLFGYISSGGAVKNLGLENFTVSGTDFSDYVGGLVGWNDGGGISNCYSTGAVSGSSSSNFVGGLVGLNYDGSISDCYSTGAVSGSGSFVGGLVGSNGGSISNCYSTGAVSGYSYVGGLVGENDSSISNCFSTGTVTGGDYSSYLGGLVGYSSGSISDCYSTGTVSGSYDSYMVGGLVGYNYGSISDCYSTGPVSGYCEVGGLVGYHYGSISDCYSTGAVSGSYSVGGLVGYNEFGSISDCYSTGSVSGSGSSVGGLVGWNYYGSISDCYSTGTVSGSGSYYVGGLVGSNTENGNINNCYSTGSVSGSNNIGGLVGYNNGSISNCYFLATSGLDNGYGTPLTDAQMKQQSRFVGWDFTNETANGTNDYWRMCIDGVDYPRLNWESIAGDFACPDGVNIEDLDYFVQRWLLGDCASSNNCDGTDMNTDGTVNFIDFALFAQNWLEM